MVFRSQFQHLEAGVSLATCMKCTRAFYWATVPERCSWPACGGTLQPVIERRESVEIRNPEMRTESAPVQFLLQPGGGYVDLRAIARHQKTDQRFIPADRPERVMNFIREHPGHNIYFGAASRRSMQNGRLGNCFIARALWVDVDFKNTPEPDARARLDAFPKPPNIIVQSGNGLHVYWLLDEPVDLQTGAADFRIACAVGGDMASAEPAHILRIPGTRNYKIQSGAGGPH